MFMYDWWYDLSKTRKKGAELVQQLKNLRKQTLNDYDVDPFTSENQILEVKMDMASSPNIKRSPRINRIRTRGSNIINELQDFLLKLTSNPKTLEHHGKYIFNNAYSLVHAIVIACSSPNDDDTTDFFKKIMVKCSPQEHPKIWQQELKDTPEKQRKKFWKLFNTEDSIEKVNNQEYLQCLRLSGGSLPKRRQFKYDPKSLESISKNLFGS